MKVGISKMKLEFKKKKNAPGEGVTFWVWPTTPAGFLFSYVLTTKKHNPIDKRAKTARPKDADLRKLPRAIPGNCNTY